MIQKPLFTDEQLPTSSVHQARLQIFQPTRRPKAMTRSITTPWGSGRIIGKLGQAHADLLEAIMRNATKHRVDDDPDSPTFGALELLVDPHTVRVTAAGGEGRRSYQQTKDLLADLMAVVIDIEGDAVNPMRMSHIIDEVVDSTVPAPARPGVRRGLDGNKAERAERYYWYVRLAPTFTRFFGTDLPLHYDPAPIARLENGVSQAVARHVLTHRHEPQGGWTIDGLLEAVGATKGPPEAIRHRRRELRKDAERLRALGMVIEGKKLRRDRG